MNRLLSALRSIERRADPPPEGAAAGASAPAAVEAAQLVAFAAGEPADVHDSREESAAATVDRIDADVARATNLVEELLADEAVESSAPFQVTLAAPPRLPAQAPEQTAAIRDAWPANLSTPAAPTLRPPAAVYLPAGEPSPEYRKLAWRIALDAGGRDRRWPILLVSAGEQTLERFDLAALAAALADGTDEVILIDGRDGGAPRPPEGATGQVGLAQLIAGSAGWPEVIAASNLPGVYFVAGGSPEPRRPGWDAAAGRIWRQLPHLDRHVLVAGGAAGSPLALALAGCSQSTYLVVALGEDQTSDLRSILAELRVAGANLRGAIALASRGPLAA